MTIPQIRHVLGDLVATRLLRLIKSSRCQSEHKCPFCGKQMSMVGSQEPPLTLEACRACSVVWFDRPSYETLPQLTVETTNSMAMQATEILALNRLKELKEREEAARRQAQKRKPLHRIPDTRSDDEPTR